MPQLDFATYPGQVIWLAISFIILYVLMARVALPRVTSVLAARRDRIATDLDQADRLKKEAEDALAAYEKALADARARAHEIASETRKQVEADIAAQQQAAEAQLAQQAKEAEARIQAARQDAMTHVESIAAETASALVSRLLGQNPDDGAVQAAVKDSL